MKHRSALIVCAFAIGLTCLVPPAAQAQNSKPATDFPDFRRVVADAKEKVFPSVVYIRVIRDTTDYGKKEAEQISGSGVVISPEGEVLTNWHVVDKANTVRCLLSDGRHFDAKVVGTDKDTDLAIIRLQLGQGETVPVATIGDSTPLREGDFVMAMGAPWGLNRSVSIGIISCTRRYLEGASEYAHWLQTDAAINPGNSGGPLVNTAGEVIGLNARGMSGWAEGLGFAIPAEAIKLIVPQLRQTGHVNWTWTGLKLQALRDFNREIFFSDTEGVIVSDTEPESPARRAGILPKDRIVRVNGKAVTAATEEDIPTVNRVMGLLPKGAEATFELVRDGNPVTVKFTPREKGKVEGAEYAIDRLDFTIKAINQFDNPDLYFYKKEGLFVHGVKWPGNASNSGIGIGDILLKIEDKDVKTIDEVRAIAKELVANVETKNRAKVTVLRRGAMRQFIIDFQRDYSKE